MEAVIYVRHSKVKFEEFCNLSSNRYCDDFAKLLRQSCLDVLPIDPIIFIVASRVIYFYHVVVRIIEN